MPDIDTVLSLFYMYKATKIKAKTNKIPQYEDSDRR
jgi:hypothetical protein